VTDWAAVQANDFAAPEHREVAELVDELCAMLASPLPQVRDDTACTILTLWAARGVLDGQLRALGDLMAERLGHDERAGESQLNDDVNPNLVSLSS
jgi:uncharacterized protein (DUF934 family)